MALQLSLTKSLVWASLGVVSLFCSIQSKQKFIHVFAREVNAMHRLKITTIKYNQEITQCKSGFHGVHESGFINNLEMTQAAEDVHGFCVTRASLELRSEESYSPSSLIDMEGHLHQAKPT